MNGWIVLAAVASITITALLTWWLYRINATPARGNGHEGGSIDGGGERGH